MVALRIHDARARLSPPTLKVHGVSASFEVAAPPKMRVFDVQAQLVIAVAPQLKVMDVFAQFANAPVRHVWTGGVWEPARRHVWTSGAWVAVDEL